MKQSFNLGQLDPYSIILTTDVPKAVFTSQYFKFENSVIHKIITSQSPKYVDKYSFTGVSFFNGQDVPLNVSMAYLNKASSLYNSSLAVSYRLSIGRIVNKDESASLVVVYTKVDPNSEAIVSFITSVRDILSASSNMVIEYFKFDSVIGRDSSNSLGSNVANLYLFGGYTTTLDVQVSLYKLVPIMVASTVAVVIIIIGYSYHSLGLVVQLIFTMFISLAITYGLMVEVYQPGPGQRAFQVLTPSLSTSTGIYWIIPIMSFSILVGLALDYDIFLISRVVEYRRKGWSDRAAVCLAVEQTGAIITTAGLIMCVSFAGLLIPATTVLNQYGFSLFIGVAIDTFIVRSFLVPSVRSIFERFDTDVLYVLSIVGIKLPCLRDGRFVDAVDESRAVEATAEVRGALEVKTVSSANWWPGRMPPIRISTFEEEEVALRLGFLTPEDYILSKNGVEENS